MQEIKMYFIKSVFNARADRINAAVLKEYDNYRLITMTRNGLDWRRHAPRIITYRQLWMTTFIRWKKSPNALLWIPWMRKRFTNRDFTSGISLFQRHHFNAGLVRPPKRSFALVAARSFVDYEKRRNPPRLKFIATSDVSANEHSGGGGNLFGKVSRRKYCFVDYYVFK